MGGAGIVTSQLKPANQDQETPPDPQCVPHPGAPSARMRYVTPGGAWRIDDIAELWASRELLVVLIARDLKVRYRQAVIGVAWVLLQPLATLAIFQVLFGLLGKRPASDEAPYAVSAFAGLLTWQLFAAAVRDGTVSLSANRQILTRVYFPRLLLPASTVGCALFDFLVAAPVLAGLMWWTGAAPTANVWLAPLFLALAAVTAFAAATWLSALNALYRDVGYVVPFLLQIGFFVSPVIYETRALIPERWRWLYELNPLATAIGGLRWALFGTALPATESLVLSTLLTLGLLGSGLVYFRYAEQWLADRV